MGTTKGLQYTIIDLKEPLPTVNGFFSKSASAHLEMVAFARAQGGLALQTGGVR
jgi:hypothetical protein